MAVLPGNVEFPEARVIPNCVIAAGVTGSIAAGSVTVSGGFWGILQFDHDDGDQGGLVVDMIVRVPKKAATVMAKGDLLTFDLIAASDAYEADIAASGEEKSAICLEADAAGTATDILVRFLLPEYNLVP